MNVTFTSKAKIEPVVGALGVVDEARRESTPTVAALTAPARAARGRADEHLFVLVALTQPASAHLCRELREVIGQTYWATEGSITAALRQAASAANRRLFQHNLHAAPGERRYGGVVCAVLHGEDLFILHAGPAAAYVLHDHHLRGFPREKHLPHLGMAPVVETRLYHSFVAEGDTLLLATPSLVGAVEKGAFARVMPRAKLDELLDGLEQIGAGADFSALVARFVGQRSARERQPVRQPQSKPQSAPPQRSPRPAPAPTVRPAQTEPQPRRKPKQTPPPEPKGQPQRTPQARPREAPRPKPEPSGPTVGERLSTVGARVWRGVRSGLQTAGGAIGVFFVTLGRGLKALFLNMLPGVIAERRRARKRRSPPPENPAVMMALAVAIPIIVAIIVGLAYRAFGQQARFDSLINQAEQEVVAAQTSGEATTARTHWEAALSIAQRAANLKGEAEEVEQITGQAQQALDEIHGVTRLPLTRLITVGDASGTRRLVVKHRNIYVLNPRDGWVVPLTLNEREDAVIEEIIPRPLIHTGQEISNGTVGDLVDFTWIEAAGGRQTSGLVVLEESGGLVTHNPQWGDGASSLQRSFIARPPEWASRIATYEGRLYVLDPTAGQLWRYMPQGDAYSEPASAYFVSSPEKPLTEARDLVIDGAVYVLYQDNTLLKFMGGEPEVGFKVRGLPDALNEAVALALDPTSEEARLYLGDQGQQRVIVLAADGTFQSQYRLMSEELGSLEALAVDGTARRLYVLAGGVLYMASLP